MEQEMGASEIVDEPRTDPIVVRIVEAVAEHEGVDPLELPPTLSEMIDPEAVEELMIDQSTGLARDEVRLEFTYSGYEVTVDGGAVHVSDE